MSKLSEEINARIDAREAEKKALEEKDNELSLMDKMRLISQGALMNFGDEAIAGVRAISPNITFKDAVAEERALVDDAREKKGSLKWEIGGAVAPALLAAPFTAGASIPATALRLAGTGAAAGLTSAIGDEEGNLLNRVTENPENLAIGTALGAVAAPIASGAAKVIGSPIKSAISKMTDKRAATPVRAEIGRILDESNIIPENLISRINEGEILADMSEQARNATRAHYANAGSGGQIIADAVKKRADELPLQAMENIQTALAPNNPVGNLGIAMNSTIDDLKFEQGKAYNKIFEETPPLDSAELNDTVLQALQRNTKLRSDVATYTELAGKPPLFEAKDGMVSLNKNVDLEEAESIRRLLKDQTTKYFRNDKGTRAEVTKSMEGKLRSLIDDTSEPLAATRANWSDIMKMRDAFDVGKSILGKTSDEAEMYYQSNIASASPEIKSAFNEGIASAAKGKAGRGQRSSLLNNISDPARSQNHLIEMVLPDEASSELLGSVARGSQALKTKNAILGGSPTAITKQGVKRIGSSGGLADLADLVSGNPSAVPRLARRILGFKADKLSEKQLEKIGEILVSEDPELIRTALTDTASRQALVTKANQVYNAITTVPGVSAAQQAGSLNGETSNNNYAESGDGSLSSLSDSISKNPKTIAKIVAAAGL